MWIYKAVWLYKLHQNVWQMGAAGSARTPWGSAPEGIEELGWLTGRERWPQAWTPKIYDRSPPLPETSTSVLRMSELPWNTSRHQDVQLTSPRTFKIHPTMFVVIASNIRMLPTYTCVTNYVDQQTLNPDDDYYVLPHQRLWTFDVLVCPLSTTERFLSQPLVCGTVFHRTSLLSPLSPSAAVVLNHISSNFLIPLSDSSLICTVPAKRPVIILDTLIVIRPINSICDLVSRVRWANYIGLHTPVTNFLWCIMWKRYGKLAGSRQSYRKNEQAYFLAHRIEIFIVALVRRASAV